MGPDPAAVPRHDAMRNRKSHARAGIIGVRVQPLKHAEQLVGVLHIEADAVVAYRIDDLRVCPLRLDSDVGRFDATGVLDGVIDEIQPDQVQQRAIAIDRRQCAGLDVRRHPRAARKRIADDLPDHCVHVDGFELQRLTTDAGKFQQIVDELRHAVAGVADGPQITHALPIETRRVVLLQQARVTIDGP